MLNLEERLLCFFPLMHRSRLIGSTGGTKRLFYINSVSRVNFFLPYLPYYSSPFTQVFTSGNLSKILTIMNGTHQGCPLSPSIFNLMMETLVEAIRSHSHIPGFNFQQILNFGPSLHARTHLKLWLTYIWPEKSIS